MNYSAGFQDILSTFFTGNSRLFHLLGTNENSLFESNTFIFGLNCKVDKTCLMSKRTQASNYFMQKLF